MRPGASPLDASEAARRFHTHRASLRARRLNNRPPGRAV